MNLVFVDAASRFLARLEGVVDPEEKRRIVGDEFIRVFEAQAELLGPLIFWVRERFYPDVIESTSAETRSAVKIKTHHNVGGLPADLVFLLVEPLPLSVQGRSPRNRERTWSSARDRRRQPFPGPVWRCASSAKSLP